VGVPLSRTFIINPKGQLVKASSTVQSSTWSSLSAINELVEEVFPYMEAGAPTSSLPPVEEPPVPAAPAVTAATAAADAAGAVSQPSPVEAVLLPQQQQQAEGEQAVSSSTATAAAAAPAAGNGGRSSSDSSGANAGAGERRMVTQDSSKDPDWAVLVGTGTVPFSSLPRGSDSSSRSSTDTAAATAPPAAVATASRGAAPPQAAAAAQVGPSSGKVDGLDAKGWPNTVAISAVAQGSAGTGAAPSSAAKAPAAGATLDRGASGQSPPGTARVSVGPAREEFNDNQYWRVTPLSFNVEEELQQSMRRRSAGSSAGGALVVGGGSGFTTASSSMSSSRRASYVGAERGSSFGGSSTHP
jgi:hypothetical protein